MQKTGKGHGTDKGLLAGLLGLSVDDTRIKNIFDLDISKSLNINLNILKILTGIQMLSIS